MNKCLHTVASSWTFINIDKGDIHQTPLEIIRVFAKHYKHKYGPLEINTECMSSMLNAIHPSIRATQNIHGDHHINLEEMEQALRKSNNNKAPGPDGIASAFYVENWETVKEDLRDVLNRTIEQETTEMYQNQGIIICLPKSNSKNTLEGYRPITLLNRLQDSSKNLSTADTADNGETERKTILLSTRKQYF